MNVDSLREKISEFADWDSLIFNDRLYSVDETDNRDGNYLVDVLLNNDGDDWKIKDRPFPKCEAVASSGGLPTWVDLLKNVEKVYSKTSDSLKDIQGDIDPKLRVYTQLQVSTLFEQVAMGRKGTCSNLANSKSANDHPLS